jgi:hypothetical protein
VSLPTDRPERELPDQHNQQDRPNHTHSAGS